MGKDNSIDKKKSEIKWGADKSIAQEILHQGDHLNVDPTWLAGVRQHDAYSCAYFVLTALDRLKKDNRTIGGTTTTHDEVQSRVVRSHGLDRLREYLQADRQDQLSSTEFRDRLVDLSPEESEVFISRADLDYAHEGMTPGQIAVEATRRGFGVGIEIHNQGHLVFAIGSSSDGKELICWDPLLGSPDTNYPTTMLRRIDANSPQVYMWGGLKLSDKFKTPKIHNVPTEFIYEVDDNSAAVDTPHRVVFGDEREPEIKSNRRGLLQRIADFFNSF